MTPEKQIENRLIFCIFSGVFAAEKQTPAQVIKDMPQCKADVNTFGVADLDLSPSARAWLEAIQKHGEFNGEFLDRVAGWLNQTLAARRGL